jgi:hypothetical protein
MDPDLVAIASLVGNTGLLKKTAANTWSLDTTQYATQSGLNAVAGAPGKLMVGDEWPSTPENFQMFYATTPIGGASKGFYYWDDYDAIWVEVQPALVSWDAIEGEPDTLAGYGITDAYTKTETYTKAEVNSAISAATPTFASLTGKPTTLGGYGITDAQPLDGDLSSIAGLAGTSGILTKTGANTWALDTNTYLTAHPSVSGATSANNSGLTYVQDLTFDANGHVTGIQSVAIQSASTSQAGVAQLSDSTSTTSSVLAATSTAVKSAYDVASAALPKAGGSMTGSIVIPTGQHITLTDAPSVGTDAVNKNYVDGNLAGLTWKNSVKAATNGNITLSGAQTVDGVALVAGDRVLVKNQTTASANGIYVVAAGAWTRSTDMDATTPINEVNSAAVFVEGGTTFADTGWTQVNNVSTLETDAIAFTQFNGASGITAGVGLVKSGNTLDVNLGAGIAQLPTDEVGVDVYATGGLMTTVDGTTSSTLTNAQLSLVKVGTAGTYKSVTTDDFGRVTAGSNPTTLAGYGITDAAPLSHTTDYNLHLNSAQNIWLDAITATSAEVNYLSGVTSNVQTQLDAKFAKTGGTIAGNVAIYTTGNASIEIGRIDGTSATPYIDFHSGASANDYDSRIIASGGNGTAGQGSLQFIAGGGHTFTGPITAASAINGTTIPTSKTLVVTTDIGTSVQAYDADLAAIAALAGTSGYLKKTAADTWTLDTATLATDSNVVHIAGTETITGAKTFTSDINLVRADVATRLDIQNTSSTASRWPGLNIVNYNGSFGGHPVLEMVSYRGSQATPTAVLSGDVLGGIGAWGYNGSIVNDVARIYFKAASNFNGTTDDGSIEFWTQTGTTLTKRMSVASNGTIDFMPGPITNYFYAGYSGSNPILAFDSNDYLAYDRTNNGYNFYIGGTSELSLTSTAATFGGTVTGTSFNSITGLSSTSPAMDGTATVGTGTTVARADHVHPTDTSRLSTGGGTLTGALTLSSTVPSIYFDETDAVVDSKKWLLVADSATFQVQTRTDANVYVATPMALTRTGDATFAGNVKVYDNKNLFVGTGSDLYLIHDGTNSSITNQTGILTINSAVGPLVLQQNTTGSNFELWANAAYLDATTTYIRNQAASSTFVTIDSTDLQSNVPILVTASPGTTGQLDIVNGSASTWAKSMIRNDGTDLHFLTSGTQTTQALAIAATWTSARPLMINLATGAIYLDNGSVKAGTTIGGDLIVGGNLTVNGTTTTINATTLTVDDKNIELGSVTTPTNTTADGGGITLKGTTDKTILWSNSGDTWTSSESWNLVTGKNFRINNLPVLGSSQLTLQASSATEGGQITLAYGNNFSSAGEGASTWNIDAWNAILRVFRYNSSGVAATALTINEDTSAVFNAAVTASQFGTTYGNTSSASLTTAAVTQVALSSLPAATFRTVEYLIQATSGTSYHTTKVHAIHDGTNTWVNEYSTMFTGSSLATFTVDVSGGNIRLLVTPASATSTTFKVVSTAIVV